jgi:hypothetical protein
MLQIRSYGIRFSPPSFQETKKMASKVTLVSVHEYQFLKQQTCVHKSSGTEIFCGNRCWKHEYKINVVTVQKYCYLGFRLSIVRETLQANMGNFIWTYGSPNLEYTRITCEKFRVDSYKHDKLQRCIQQISRLKYVLLVNTLFTTIILLIKDNTNG